MSSASARAAGISSSAGSTRFTKPQAAACSAPTQRAESETSRARYGPMARLSRCDKPHAGAMPMRVCVSAKRAVGLAYSTSQASASSKPPVTAAPCTAPITGPLKRPSAATGSRSATPLSPLPNEPVPDPSSFKSSPAQKARPAPVRMSTRTAGSASSASMASASAAIRPRESAFIACGRFIVSTA